MREHKGPLLALAIFIALGGLILLGLSSCSDPKKVEVENTLHTAFSALSQKEVGRYCWTVQRPGTYASDCEDQVSKWIKQHPGSAIQAKQVLAQIKKGQYKINIGKEQASAIVSMPESKKQTVQLYYIDPGPGSVGRLAGAAQGGWRIDVLNSNRESSPEYQLPG